MAGLAKGFGPLLWGGLARERCPTGLCRVLAARSLVFLEGRLEQGSARRCVRGRRLEDWHSAAALARSLGFLEAGWELTLAHHSGEHCLVVWESCLVALVEEREVEG